MRTVRVDCSSPENTSVLNLRKLGIVSSLNAESAPGFKRMSQSDEQKNYFGTRLCVLVNHVRV